MNKNSLLEHLNKSKVPQNIINAFEKVNREDFIPEEFLLSAYDDIPIPLPEPGSTLAQPSTIALMLQLLDVKPWSKVLEIGSGSGYVLKLLSNLTNQKIYGAEINTKMASDSIKHLKDEKRITIFNVDGSNGLPSQAPFDRILISASAPDLATIYGMIDQLNESGILVAPVQDSLVQMIKNGKNIEKHEFPGFRFVKLVKSK
jgi:protein-L-isoaspartate(D-aspartate) O-methyltransferase